MITSREIKEAIQELAAYSILTTIQKVKLFSIINYILRKSYHKDNPLFDGWVEIPAKTLATKYGTRYARPLMSILLENGILEETGYSTEQKKCKAYRFHPAVLKTFELEKMPADLLDSKSDKKLTNPTIDIFEFNEGLFTDVNSKFKPKTKIRASVVAKQIKELSSGVLSKGIDSLIEVAVSTVDEAKYYINEDVRKEKIITKNESNGKVATFSLKSQIDYATSVGKVVIQDRQKVVLADSLEQYKSTKKLNVAVGVGYILNNLQGGNYYVNRNETNLRLDTAFTMMHGTLFSKIAAKNELVEIDFKNSQFAILANILFKRGITQGDASMFINMAVKGVFYSYLAKQMGITRAEAKSRIFGIIFSNSVCDLSDEARAFTKMFPVVSQAIKDLKKECKEAGTNLPVYLQKIESNIVLDAIYSNIRKDFTNVVTKHDAIYCKAEDKQAVVEAIKDICKQINFAVSINGTYEGEVIEITDAIDLVKMKAKVKDLKEQVYQNQMEQMVIRFNRRQGYSAEQEKKAKELYDCIAVDNNTFKVAGNRIAVYRDSLKVLSIMVGKNLKYYVINQDKKKKVAPSLESCLEIVKSAQLTY